MVKLNKYVGPASVGISAAAIIIGIVCSVTGIGQTSGAATAGDIPADAVTATGTAAGMLGDVTVEIKATADKIYSVEVTEQNETPELGGVAATEVPAAIVEANSLDVDGVSGATITSDAIKTAISAALESAGLDPSAFGGAAAEADSGKITKVSEVEIPEVPDVQPTQENGVISAEEWEEYYPAIVASQKANAENTERVKYTEEDPNIQILYQGMGFAFDYTSAIGHEYTLQDIGETTRPHKLANCLTCKSPDFTALVNNEGVGAYSMAFDDVYSQLHENISCYNCHENTPGIMVLTHDYAAATLNDNIDDGTVDAVNASCAQCHIEYYFDPETKATKMPYDGPENFDPDSIYEYYAEMGNFTDFTNENTGVGMIKVQHPEFETYTGEGSVHNGTYNCADCHMGVSYDEDGNAYVNHKFTSPLDNQELIDSTCSTCHEDLAGYVHDIQEKMTAREDEISDSLVELNSKLADAVADGTMSDEELDELRELDRKAQFYWDFVYVENSEGAHNSKLDNECLDKAEDYCRQALEKL